jgi:hypothetical protein
MGPGPLSLAFVPERSMAYDPVPNGNGPVSYWNPGLNPGPAKTSQTRAYSTPFAPKWLKSSSRETVRKESRGGSGVCIFAPTGQRNRASSTPLCRLFGPQLGAFRTVSLGNTVNKGIRVLMLGGVPSLSQTVCYGACLTVMLPLVSDMVSVSVGGWHGSEFAFSVKPNLSLVLSDEPLSTALKSKNPFLRSSTLVYFTAPAKLAASPDATLAIRRQLIDPLTNRFFPVGEDFSPV